MTPQEAAKWIRLAMRAFKAHPEKWCRGRRIDDDDGRMCILGGAGCLALGRRATCGEILSASFALSNVLDWSTERWLLRANDESRDVAEMCRRVEAVLKEAGL